MGAGGRQHHAHGGLDRIGDELESLLHGLLDLRGDVLAEVDAWEPWLVFR